MANTANRSKTIRVSMNEDVERLLEIMQQDYPALDYAEILNLGLSELYRKREKENRQAWIDSLPTMELTEEQQIDLAEAIKEADENPRQIMTPEEILAEAHCD